MFKITRLSTIRFINSHLPPKVQYVDWDANADITELPSSDIVGLHAFSILNEGKMFSLNFGVTIAVSDDPNLFRMNDYIDRYFNLMLPEKTFLIYNEAAQPIAKAIFTNGVAVHPVSRFETRVAQSIQASADLTLTQQPD